MSTYVADTPLPFAPIPDDPSPMKLNPTDSFTVTDTPIGRAWESAYRECAIAVRFDMPDRARTFARLGMDLEDAYMKRMRERSRAERDTRPLAVSR